MMARLRRVDPTSPGISRRGSADRPRYCDAAGGRISAADRERIEALVIPPAWKDVWICPTANGHIQAVGVDDRGRRQYLYHEQWRLHRDREKFARVERLGRRLPRLREQIATDLAATDQLERERVTAAAVRLLDLGVFRVGSKRYAEENGTYGLTTMLREQVDVDGDGSMSFNYLAKGSIEQVEQVRDPEVADVVRRLKRRRSGDGRLFAWRDGRSWRELGSDEVNAYIKLGSGIDDTSAKDLRTWSATVLAAVALARHGTESSTTARKRAISGAIREVADQLGNTPAVCRASYVDPRVLDAYLQSTTIASALTRAAKRTTSAERRDVIERATLRLLRSQS